MLICEGLTSDRKFAKSTTGGEVKRYKEDKVVYLIVFHNYAEICGKVLITVVAVVLPLFDDVVSETIPQDRDYFFRCIFDVL